MQTALTCNSEMTTTQNKKVYVTDMERDLTFYGTVKSMVEHKGFVSFCLSNVAVYEYSSSNYLYNEAEVTFSRPQSVIHIEEA